MTDIAPPIALADATVTIIGLGLLGGSIGMALDGQCARRIGVVRSGDVDGASAALERGAVDTVNELGRAVAAADLVILATPVEVTLELLPQVAAHLTPGAVVTDLGSTKVAVVDAMRALDVDATMWGGHPMRGGVEQGIEHARGDLFRGGPWALCQVGEDPDPSILGHEHVIPVSRSLPEQLIAACNATMVLLDAAEHDAIVARTSHLPYVVAQAVAHTTDAVTHHALRGSGLAGATRMARGDVTMWGGVLRTNAGEVLAAIDELVSTLQEAATRIAAGGPIGELDAWLDAGRTLAIGDEADTPGTLRT